MNQRERIEQRRKERQRKKRLTYILIGAGVALIVAAFLIIPSLNKTDVETGDLNIPEFEEQPMADGAAVGNPDAPVVIENYSDFACPHCKDFAETTEEQIISQYVENGDVYLVFNSVGNLLSSPASVQAAEAAYCAGDQNQFWPFQDLIFANQASLFTDTTADISPTLNRFAQILELDMETYEECYQGDKYKDRVQQDMQDARQAGISGTPSFLVNGRLLKGNVPMSNFQQIIEEELASQ